MTQPRLSTVYDFSNLRIHPDGTRVYQKETNLRPNLTKITVQGPRASWIARDVGGSGKIPKHRKRVKDPSNEGEQEEKEYGFDDEDEEEEFSEIDDKEKEETEDEDNQKPGQSAGRKRKPKRFNPYIPKRQKFAADYDHLKDASSASSSPRAGPSSEGVGPGQWPTELNLPDPSPDLIKFIHRFAAEFYTERGQLLNSSRKYRKQRKARAHRRLLRREIQVRLHKARVNPGSLSEWSDTDSESENSSSSETKSDEESEEDEGEEAGEEADQEEDVNADEGPPNDSNGKGKENARSRKGAQYRKDEELYTDMYKMFDGTAIMALGMLVQEHIAQMLMPEIPMGWNEEVEKAFGDLSTEDLTADAEGEGEDGGLSDEDRRDEDAEEVEEAEEGSSDEDESEEEIEEEAQAHEDEDENENSDEHMAELQNNLSNTATPHSSDVVTEKGYMPPKPNQVSQQSSKHAERLQTPVSSAATASPDCNDALVRSDTEDSD